MKVIGVWVRVRVRFTPRNSRRRYNDNINNKIVASRIFTANQETRKKEEKNERRY